MRTPSRSSIYYNCDSAAGSANNDNNKKLIAEHSIRIATILRSNVCPFGGDFLPGGLKTISAKQFYVVMAFFMKTLTGKNNNNIVNNSPDEVLKFLTIIGYPYTITKSLLKTPNVPHAYPVIVGILGWLCDLINTDDKIVEFENNEYIVDVDNQYPDKDYTKMFWNKVKDNFCDWNDCKDSRVNACLDWLLDEFIGKKFIKNGNINNFKDLCTEKSNTELECNSLLGQEISTQKISILIEKRKKLKDLQKEKQQLTNKYDELSIVLKDIRESDSESSAELSRKEQKFEHLQSIIAKQKYSIDDLKNIAKLLAELKQKIITKKDIIKKLKDNCCFPIEIAIARLQKQLIDVITNYNVYVTKIINICKQFNLIINDDDKTNNISTNNLWIDFDNFQANNDFIKKIDEILANLEAIRLNIHEHITIKSLEIVSLENNEKIIAHEGKLIIAENEKLNELLEQLRMKILDCDMEIQKQKHVNEIILKECKQRREELAKQLIEKQEKIEEYHKKRIEMINTNDKIVERVKEKADEMLAARKRDLEDAKLVLSEFNKNMKKMSERFQNLPKL